MGKSWLREWWWVLCFCVVTTSIYFQNMQEKKRKLAELMTRQDSLHREMLLATQERDSLRLQMDSQNDPSWIEMVLMRDLGVVPEGWLKVHFAK
jgi:hypothetical protein